METTAELEAVFLSGQPLSPVKRVQPAAYIREGAKKGYAEHCPYLRFASTD